MEAKTKLEGLNVKLKDLWDVMEKIEAAQARLKKVEEKLFLETFLRNRLSTALIMKRIKGA